MASLMKSSALLVAKRPLLLTRALSSAAAPWLKQYETILTEKKDKVAVITLNRPKALNALNDHVLNEIIDALKGINSDSSVGAIVLTGSKKAFAAGADIKEMATQKFSTVFGSNMYAQWQDVAKSSKPIVSAVTGFALGGGCEVMMMTDIVVAGDNAKFAQPEITLGVIPGAGGTQRLVRAVGKSKAMEMILTGNMIDAHQAERDGLVSKVVPADEALDTAIKIATKIASFSQPAVAACKETVNAAFEMTLNEGLHFERRIFHSMFALNDQKEGMAAFIEKRKPNFTNT